MSVVLMRLRNQLKKKDAHRLRLQNDTKNLVLHNEK